MSEPANDTPQPEAPEVQEGEKGIQDRINSLVRRRNDAERAANDATKQNEELNQQIQQLSQEVTRLKQGSVSADPFEGLFSSTSSKPKAGHVDPQALANIVQQAVSQALAPIHQERENNARQTALRAEQDRSFKAVAQGIPELNDVNSEEFRTFAQIWDNDPGLQSLPNGPAIAIAAAQGIVSSARRASKTEVQNKRAATVTGPRGPSQLTANDTDKAKELVGQLSTQGAERGWSPAEEANYIKLKMMEALSKQE
jgi:hypothetical protein